MRVTRPAHFTGALAKIPSVNVVSTSANGKVVGLTPHLYHSTPETVGLAARHSWDGGEISEHEYIGKNGRAVRAVGRLLLDEVSVDASVSVGTGERIGVYPISPSSFGERLGLLSKMFEQTKCHRMRVVYIPSVAATVGGSLAMYMRQDMAAPMLDLGVDELRHAATHPAFTQFQVWEQADIEVNPKDILKEYFTSPNGDSRLSVQGVVTLLSASPLSLPDGAVDYATYGSLYLYYDFEFFSEELSYEEDSSLQGELWLNFNNADLTKGTLFALQVNDADPAAGEYKMRFLGTPPDASDIILWIIPTKTTIVGGLPVQSEGNHSFLKPGTCAVVRFYDDKGGNNFLDGSISAYLFADFDSATSTDYTEGADDALRFDTDSTVNGIITCQWRAYKRNV